MSLLAPITRPSLRRQLAMLVAAALIPLAGLSLINAQRNASTAMERATDSLQFAAGLVAASQARVVDSAHHLLRSLAGVPGLLDGNEADCQRYLANLKSHTGIYANLGIVHPDGRIRCHALGSSLPGVFVGDKHYVQAAFVSKQFSVGGYTEGRASGKPVITFTLPVTDSSGKVAALVFASMDLDEISVAAGAASLPPGGQLAIMDTGGIVLATNPASSGVVGKPISSFPIRQAVQASHTGAGVKASSAIEDAQRLFALSPARASGQAAFFVAVSADREAVLLPVRQQFGLELLVLSLVALLAGWLAWAVAGRAIMKPAARIVQASRQFERGQLDARIAVDPRRDAGELATIGDAFNRMAQSLQTQQGALETELASSRLLQEKLRDAQRLARIGYWQFDLATEQLHLSAEILDILGIDAALFAGTFRHFLARVHQADRRMLESACGDAVRSGADLDIEFRVVLHDGRERWIHQFGLVSTGSEPGQASVLTGVIQDITDRHAAQVHSRLLETCISRLNDVVMITEADPAEKRKQRIVFVNDAFTRQTGYSLAEALGKSPHFLWGPNTRQLELARIGRAMKRFRPVRSELTTRTKAGEERWLELDMVPIADEHGRITHWVSVSRDITQRKLAAQELFSSEQRYAALFNTAPVPMWVYDIATTRYLAVNEAAVEAYGYSNAEFMSMTIFDVRPEAEHAQLRQWLAEPVRKNRVWHDRRKDGSLFPVEIVCRPVQYAGQDARFVIALDKSVQEKAEKAVQDYLFTLQRAADAAQAITWHQSLEGTMQEIADQARGVIGAHQAAVSLVSDSPDAPAMHALSISEKYGSHRGLLERFGGSSLCSVVCENNRPVRLTQAELEVYPCWLGSGGDADRHPPMRGCLAVPLIGKNGKNMGVLQLSDRYEGEFTMQDEYVALELGHLASAGLENSRLLEKISRLNAGLEQKVAERTAALARQEALFRALAEQAPQTIWTASPDGRVTYMNRAWFDLVGGQLADWEGYRWLAAIHPDDVADVKTNWRISIDTRSTYSGIRRLKARDGSFHTMAYRAAPVFDDQGAIVFWVGIDADVTDMKAIEAALRLSNHELEAFSYSVSHDLRSPLNTIDGFSRLLARQVSTDTNPRVAHYLMRIQAGVAQMGQLIEDLLSLSQVARATLHAGPVDLSAMALSLLDEWKVHQPERQVAIAVEKGLQAQGDERLLKVAMGNLLANAWKFTSQTAQAEITVGRQVDSAGSAVFFVKDNGAGFDMAYSDKLFIPFQRLHTGAEFSGTGIGLATVSRVIKRHGGHIWAESAPARGATFFFTLP